MKLTMTTLIIYMILTSNSALAEDYHATGKIKFIDLASREITIKHDRISSLAMAAMPMIFRVPEPSLLEKVNTGQKIDFMFTINQRGKYLITDIK